MKTLTTLATLTLALLPCGASFAASVVSGGAVEPGVSAVADLFRRDTAGELRVRFATAPAILKDIGGGATADVVIAPPAVIDALAQAGKVDGARRTPVGRVGVGVVVRNGAPAPDVSSAQALTQALRRARSVVFNKASTGLYLEKLFERLGVGAEVRGKETRYGDGASVIEHVIHGAGDEIGFGAMTEISLYLDKGAQFAGPLPADVQNYTTYVAAPTAAPADAVGGAAFLKFLGSPAARAAFQAKGVE